MMKWRLGSRSMATLLAGILTTGLAAHTAAAADPTVPPTATEVPTNTPLGIDTPLPKWTSPESRLLEHVWWNQPDVVKAAALTDRQRKQMDDLLTQGLNDERASQQKQREQRVAFEDAVTKGDWTAALQAANGLGDAVAAQTTRQNTLKIDALKLLEDSQRQILTTQYNYLLRRPWMIGVPLATGIRMRGGTAPQPPRQP